ncbi:MAG: hypothetical protein KKC79_08900 [Gammaproteobacteria bacterium]|nr:hypothetical protein [Gammaproteobacteria bacterium]
MLTPSQKSRILTRAGIDIPPVPAVNLPAQEKTFQVAAQAWVREIEKLYDVYVATRAAQSLRDAALPDTLHRRRWTDGGLNFQMPARY